MQTYYQKILIIYFAQVKNYVACFALMWNAGHQSLFYFILFLHNLKTLQLMILTFFSLRKSFCRISSVNPKFWLDAKWENLSSFLQVLMWMCLSVLLLLKWNVCRANIVIMSVQALPSFLSSEEPSTLLNICCSSITATANVTLELEFDVGCRRRVDVVGWLTSVRICCGYRCLPAPLPTIHRTAVPQAWC